VKTCSRCGVEKDKTQFDKHSSTKDKLQPWCRSCRNARRQELRIKKEGYYATERDRYREQHLLSCRKLYYRYKAQVLQHYGGDSPACSCGFSDRRALSIDHIEGGGCQHRKEIGAGVNFYRWLVKNSFPEGFQVLCMNCQFIKRYEENGYAEV